MPTCQNCGNQILENDAKYCAQCGFALPSPLAKKKPMRGIRGLLILPALAICLSPLMNLFMFWSSGHSGGSALVHGLLQTAAASFSVELYAQVSSVVLLILSAMVAGLFFARRSQAPLACLILFALYAVDNLVLAFWLHQIPFARYEVASMVTAKFMFWGALAYFWWGYISVSKRVRATFVN